MKQVYSIEEAPYFRVLVPAKVPFFPLLIVTFVAAMFNFVNFVARLSTPQSGTNLLFRVFAPGLGLAALGGWLWMFFGREIISFEGSALIHRYQILGAGFSFEFERSAVRNLRPRTISAQKNSFESAHDEVAFDYGAKTYTFGRLEPTVAMKLADDFVRRFPELRPEPPMVINSF